MWSKDDSKKIISEALLRNIHTEEKEILKFFQDSEYLVKNVDGLVITLITDSNRQALQSELLTLLSNKFGSGVHPIIKSDSKSLSSTGHIDFGRSRPKIVVKPFKRSPLHFEEESVSNLIATLKDKQGEIPIRVLNQKYYITGIRQTRPMSPAPKSDIELVTTSPTNIIYISHKSDNGFQQYSGISDSSGILNKDNEADREISKFFEDIFCTIGAEMKPAQRFYRPIASKILKEMAIFGPEIKANKYGINNVQIFAEGKMGFDFSQYKDVGDYGIIVATKSIKSPTDLNNFSSGHEPVLFARYGSGRQWMHPFKANSIKGITIGIQNCRVGIFPKQEIGSAKQI